MNKEEIIIRICELMLSQQKCITHEELRSALKEMRNVVSCNERMKIE